MMRKLFANTKPALLFNIALICLILISISSSIYPQWQTTLLLFAGLVSVAAPILTRFLSSSEEEEPAEGNIADLAMKVGVNDNIDIVAIKEALDPAIADAANWQIHPDAYSVIIEQISKQFVSKRPIRKDIRDDFSVTLNIINIYTTQSPASLGQKAAPKTSSAIRPELERLYQGSTGIH